MMMLRAILVGLLVALPRAYAQVSAEVVLGQEQFLPGESLEMALKIANRSGQTLHFGKASSWLTLHVEGEGNFSAEASSEIPDGTEFDLDSSRLATKRLDVAPLFQLTKPGRYKLTAILRLPLFPEPIISPPKSFDVITGTKLWEEEFGVPGSGNPPEVRSYLLQQANYLKQLQLYVRITRSREALPVKVVRLGQMVSFGQPSAMLDRLCDLHVIFQTGPRSFRYAAVSPEGDFKIRHTYTLSESRPRLEVDKDGAVSVKGGLQTKTADDIPVEPDPVLTEPPSTNQPAATPPTNSAAPPQ